MNKELTKIEKFSLYLYSRQLVKSNLRIQKILFFLRIYEIRKGIKKSLIFDNDKNNFQAWIYGPVNVESYKYMSPIVVGDDQVSDIDLKKITSSIEKQYDEKYGKCIDYLKWMTTSNLIGLSHKNLAYKEARKDCRFDDDPCTNFLDEESKKFVEFEDQWQFPTKF